MDQKEGKSDDNEPNPKKRRLNREQAEVAAIADDASDHPSDILKLNVDCCEEAFDYLSLDSLINISQTCKRLHQVAGNIYQQSYSKKSVAVNSVEAKHFTRFLKKIKIHSENDFQRFIDMNSEYQHLIQIEFGTHCEITRSKIEQMATSLNKIVTLHIRCKIDTDTFEALIDACPNVKHIDMKNLNLHIGQIPLIPLRAFHTLEHFGYYDDEHWSELPALPHGTEVIKFLEINQNIRHFAADAEYFWKNGELMKCANIKLDDLAIVIPNFSLGYNILELVLKQLNQFYENGFYKRLHVYYLDDIDQYMLDRMIPLKGLVKIFIFQDDNNLSFSALNQLQEICLSRCFNSFTGIQIPIDFTHLKRVELHCARFADLLHLISRAERLEKIRLPLEFYNDLPDLDYLDLEEITMDLKKLNRERTKLANGRDLKVTIYVPENVYLATKWAMKGTKFGLIKMQRTNSYEWEHSVLNLMNY